MYLTDEVFYKILKWVGIFQFWICQFVFVAIQMVHIYSVSSLRYFERFVGVVREIIPVRVLCLFNNNCHPLVTPVLFFRDPIYFYRTKVKILTNNKVARWINPSILEKTFFYPQITTVFVAFVQVIYPMQWTSQWINWLPRIFVSTGAVV